MTASIAVHLWQSTLFAGATVSLVWLLRTNHARVRYLLWLVASIKFLVPFSALAAIGSRFEFVSASPNLARLAASVAAGAVVNPVNFVNPMNLANAVNPVNVVTPVTLMNLFDPVRVSILSALWLTGTILILTVWVSRWRALQSLLRTATPLTEGRELAILRKTTQAAGMSEVPLLASDQSLAPFVFGCLKPAILWPSAIGRRMSDDQIAGILLHELAHIKRRDNLAALIHMVVQAGFWFHPATWWIGARLVDERERACDEEVVRLGADPGQYAESILLACEYAAEAPLACVAGATGSDLTRRVTTIARNRPIVKLGGVKRALLIAAGLLVTVGPIAAGAISSTELSAPDAQAPAPGVSAAATAAPGLQFEVASVKPLAPTDGMIMVRIGNAGDTFMHKGPIRLLIQQAYQMPAVRQIGGPSWLRDDPYDINARIPEGVARTPENTRAMIRALLAGRFKLVAHEEDREMPVYVLVLDRADKRLGPKLKPVTADCQATPTAEECRQTFMIQRGAIQMRNALPAQIASQIESMVGRPVIDRTGLQGRYTVDAVSFAPESAVAAGTTDLPTIYTAIREELGLKLEAERLPQKTLIIDSIQRPTPD